MVIKQFIPFSGGLHKTHTMMSLPGIILLGFSTAIFFRFRLALVSMGQEARGLDEGPRLAARLASMKDRSSARLVERIAQEEKAHVAVGLVHFLQILHLLGEDPGVIYRSWIQHLSPFLMGGKFDHGAREEVGLSRSWQVYEFLESLTGWFRYDPQEREGESIDLDALHKLRGRLEAFLIQEEEITLN